MNKIKANRVQVGMHVRQMYGKRVLVDAVVAKIDRTASGSFYMYDAAGQPITGNVLSIAPGSVFELVENQTEAQLIIQLTAARETMQSMITNKAKVQARRLQEALITDLKVRLANVNA